MKVFYPLYPQADYTELKYSLRSAEKYLNPDEVIIAGIRLPEWITGVTQLTVPDQPGKKQLNIRRKILAGLQYTKEFLFMSDDVYLLQPYELKYYSSGLLNKHGETGARFCEERLRELGMPEKDYDCHCPIFYDQKFKDVMQHFHPGSIIKSAYGNYLELPSVEMWDCKINSKRSPEMIKKLIGGRPYFSSGSGGMEFLMPVLEELFPEKSKFEL